MKSILSSIRPKWVAKIFNGKKTIEIRKKFPKDYVGWVYIYCTKEDDLGCIKKIAKDKYVCGKDFDINDFNYLASGYNGKGKVVARFWCDKVEEHRPFFHWCIEKETCLTRDEVLDYLDSKDKFVGNPKRQDKVYAIHINDLKIFDKPKELSEFKSCKKNIVNTKINGMVFETELDNSLIKAPQSWCYCEVGE